MPVLFSRLLALLFVLVAARPLPAQEAGTFDHSLYDAILRDRVSHGLVDYVALKSDARLSNYLAELEKVDPATLPRAERLAYWINAYNAATLKLMADAWPVASIKSLNNGKPWDVPVLQPRGSDRKLTLNQIEHDIIRKSFTEPRIHFALVCAARSCPPLRSEAYDGSRLSAQLAEQTKAFLQDEEHNRYEASSQTLRLSPIFKWYESDFGGTEGTPGFVLKHLAPSDREALSRLSRKPGLVFEDYDWTPNAQK